MIRVRWAQHPRAGRDDFAASEAAALQVHITVPLIGTATRVFARLVNAGETALANFRRRLDAGQ